MRHLTIAAGLILLSFASFARADYALLSWTAPTTYENGQPIQGTLDYLVYQDGEQIAETASLSHTTPDQPLDGVTFCVVARETLDGVRTQSDQACRTIGGGEGNTPNSPTLLIDIVKVSVSTQ